MSKLSGSARFIARLSGIPSTAINALHSSELLEQVGQLAAIDSQIASVREEVASALFVSIGRIEEKATRNRLLELRRSLYNGRLPSAASWSLARQCFSPDAIDIISRYTDLLETRQRQVTCTIDSYQSESVSMRSAFQDMLNDDDFQKGVLTSSPALFGNISRYRRAEPGLLRSRDEQLERGLLRYFSRASMKATPFATLCSIASGEFNAEVAEPISIDGGTEKRSFIRLNKALFGKLWYHLTRREAIRSNLQLELNPTVRVDGLCLRYLASFDGREVFQIIARNEALDLVVQLVGANRGVKLRQLIEALVSTPDLDVTSQEAAAYIESLLRAGLCRFIAVVPEQEAEWNIPLLNFLESIDDEHAKIASDLLSILASLCQDYAKSVAGDRVAILDAMRSALKTSFLTLGIGTLSAHDLPVYEDASVPSTLFIADSPDLRQTLLRIARVGEATARVADSRGEQITMRHYYDLKYPASTCVPLLTFYEDFYREHFKAHLEKVQRIRNGGSIESVEGYNPRNPFHMPQIEALIGAQFTLLTMLRKRWADSPEADEIDLSLAELEAAANSAPADPHHFSSICSFGQLLVDRARGRWRYVMSHPVFHAGFGKYFSRFLHTLPVGLVDSIRRSNLELSNDVLAEISGDSHFNGNLHPTLLASEITHPSGQGTPNGAAISVSDLDVVRAPDDPNRLLLIRRGDGAAVHPIDLGFLNPRRRPPLFQLLARFGPMSGAPIPLPDSLVTSHGPSGRSASPVGEDARVEYRPRISIDGRVIVARRRWKVPAAHFPSIRPGESPAEHFIRVGLWRLENGLPERVFVRMFATGGAKTLDEDRSSPKVQVASDRAPRLINDGECDEQSNAHDSSEDGDPALLSQSDAERQQAAQQRSSRDYHKPQFIDLSSPLLVALLGRMSVKLREFHAVIEECLPQLDDLPLVKGDRFTTELVLQLDRSENSDDHGAKALADTYDVLESLSDAH